MKIEIDPHLLEMVHARATIAANAAISEAIIDVVQRAHVPATVVREEFYKRFTQWKRNQQWDLRCGPRSARAPDARDLADSLVSGT